MWKQNKWKIILSCVLTLLPMLIGIIFWDTLPEQMATHWGIDGNIDGTSSTYIAVFLLPVILCLTNLFCLWFTAFDKKNENQNEKAFGMIFWIMPILSFFTNGLVYATAFGKEINANLLLPLMMGGMFIFIGNYLPKCKQNYTLGIKIKWTLENEENWNVTHRFGGKVWFFGGLILIFTIFLPQKVMIPTTLISMMPIVFAPVIYSYLYYRKQKKEGTYTTRDLADNPFGKKGKIISLIAVTVIFLFVGILMFTGEITVTYDEASFTVDASIYNSLSVDYDSIASVEYREDFDFGSRTFGAGSARLLAGNFTNDEFGNYILYSYTKSDAVVVIKSDKKTLVIGGIDKKATREIYETLLSK